MAVVITEPSLQPRCCTTRFILIIFFNAPSNLQRSYCHSSQKSVLRETCPGSYDLQVAEQVAERGFKTQSLAAEPHSSTTLPSRP